MADEKIIIELSLDDKEFVTKLLASKEKLKGLVDDTVVKKGKEGLDDLADAVAKVVDLGPLQEFTAHLLKMGSVIGVIAAAAASLKIVFDATLEAERVDAVNAQFNLLAGNAGLAANELKERLVPALHGLVEETKGVELANEAIIKLGASAEKIPELFELSTKVMKVMGGEVADRFEQISTAIASGNQRYLKRLGLTVNLEKAEQKYADALGLTRDTLSDQDKIQARLNAVLEVGNKKLEGVDSIAKPATIAIKQFGVAMAELYEAFAKVIAKSELIKGVFDTLGNAARAATGAIKKYLGDGAERADYLGERIAAIAPQIQKFQELVDKNPGNKLFKDTLDQYVASSKKLQTELDAIQAKTAAAKAAGEGGGGESAIHGDVDKIKEQESKFQSEITKMQEQAVQQRIQIATNEQDLRAAQKLREVALEQETEAQINKIMEDKNYTSEQQLAIAEQMEVMHQQKLLQIRLSAEAEYDRMLDNQLKAATTFSGGFAAEMAKAHTSAQRNLADTAKSGAWAFGMLQKTGESALMNLGMAAFDGGEALKKGLLGALAEVAQHYGEVYLAMGFGNPGYFAAGAALLVLAGVIKGLAGGGGGAAGGGAVSAGGENTQTSPTFNDSPQVSQMKEKKAVNLVIQGNYFETEQTKTRLIEMIREGQDATDFNVKQIGG